jgi:hypothetical protein
MQIQVIDSGSVPLSNAEVLAHLNSLAAKVEADGRVDSVPRNLKYVIREVRPRSPTPHHQKLTQTPQATTYLRMTTQPTSSERGGRFTPEAIASLTATLKGPPWRLLDAEVLQILNHAPTDGDEVTMLLEDADLRYSPTQLDAIAEAVVEKLGVRTLAESGTGKMEVAEEGQRPG